MLRTRLVLAIAVIVTLGLSVPTARFASLNLTVNSTADLPDATPGDGICETSTAPHNGECTLRAAIQEANAHAGPDTINLQPGAVYLLTRALVDDTAVSGDLDVLEDLTINGAGATIDGNGSVLHQSIFDIVTPAGKSITLTISNLTLQHADSTNPGGAMFIRGAPFSPTVTLINCTVTANSSTVVGGGIFNNGVLTLVNSVVKGNTVTGGGSGGGGIFSTGGPGSNSFLRLVNSTVSGNQSAGESGGVAVSSSPASIEGSTISGNTAAIRGGGIGVAGSSVLMLANTTISGNRSNLDGGGLSDFGGSVFLSNVTIAANIADADANNTGGGGGVIVSGPQPFLTNSIVAGNIRLFGNVSDDCAVAGMFSLGFNIVQGPCPMTGPVMVADPKLGPLASNGGPTQTQGLLPGSPAIDAGDPAGCAELLSGTLLATDQRSVPRAVNGRCDIGAYEVVTPGSLGKINPPSGAGVMAPLALSWQPTSNALGYEYCIDLINNNQCDQTWVPVAGTSAVVSVSPGTTYYWQARAVNGSTPTEADGGVWWTLTTAPTLPLYPPDRGDFTGDGKPDLIWQDPSTGAVLLQEMNGSTLVSGTMLAPGGTLWQIVGVGDFTGDGKADLLWQHPNTGAVLLWQMDGATYVGSTMINAGGTLWKIVAVADFTGDGKPDIVWQLPSTGAVLLWQMNGTTLVTGTMLNAGGTMWKVVGAPDLNGDGKADLLWQHPSTGALLYWQMNGTALVNGFMMTAGGTLYQVVATGDFTGDGKPDLIWQHPATGAVLLWQMNGTTMVGGSVLNAGGTAWRIRGPR